VGHIDARAVHVELPAVVDAAQAAFLVACPEQVRPAVRAILFEQANLAVGVAEGNQVLTEQPDFDRAVVWCWQVTRWQKWQPVLADELAHQRAWANARELLVVFLRQHGDTVPPWGSSIARV